MEILQIRLVTLLGILGGVSLASFFLGWLFARRRAWFSDADVTLISHDCAGGNTVVELTSGSAGAICAYVYDHSQTNIGLQPPDTCGIVVPTGTGQYTITGVGNELGATGNVRVVIWAVDRKVNAEHTCNTGCGTGTGTDTGTGNGTGFVKGGGIGSGIGP